MNTTDGTETPAQYVRFETALTDGTGFTVIVNVIDAPVHSAPVVGEVTGVTVIVAVTGAVPLFTAVKDAISPVPLEARPMLVLLFVQLYSVPATGPEKLTVVVDAAAQTVWSRTGLTDGVLTTGSTTVANGRHAGSVGV